jgi:hypothetical protein
MKKEKPRFTSEQISAAATMVVSDLKAACVRIAAVEKADKVDIEFVPLIVPRRQGPFGVIRVNITNEWLDRSVRQNYFTQRRDHKGLTHWGPANKDAIHVLTGVSVDLRMVEK